MDELVKMVAKKTGLTNDQAKMAVDAVLGFLKTKLPAPVAAQIDTVLGGAAAPTNLVEGLGGLLGGKKR